MATVTIVYPITINTDEHGIIINPDRLEDEDYVNSLREQIKEVADSVFGEADVSPVIQDSEYPELIE